MLKATAANYLPVLGQGLAQSNKCAYLQSVPCVSGGLWNAAREKQETGVIDVDAFLGMVAAHAPIIASSKLKHAAIAC